MTEHSGRTLVLFRHAKSAWPDVADHERPLAKRGQRDAPVMGRWLRDTGHVPDQVVCSTARRARETWQLAAASMGAAPPVTFEPGVYEASASGLLGLIRQASPSAGTLAVVGHDPALQEAALILAAPGTATGTAAAPLPGTAPPGTAPPGTAPPGTAPPGTAPPGTLERMRAKFPTAAIAVLRFSGSWPDLGPGRAQLTAFITPRELTSGDPAGRPR